MSSISKEELHAKRTLTPAIWRNYVSDGEYEIPRHIIHIDNIVIGAISGRIKERIIIIEMPPRHGKTEYFSKTLPAWYLGMYPKNRMILSSYGDMLAKDSGRKSRDLFDKHSLESFGIGLSKNVRGASEWETSEGGGLIASGIGGTITGKGADIFVVDDYLKNSTEALSERTRDSQWDWLSSTVITRMEPGSILVIMATRWHKDDLIGRIRKVSEEDLDFPGVYSCCLPAVCEEPDIDPLGREVGEALWRERFDEEALKAKKNLMLDYWWLSMFQQRPEQHGDTMWDKSYFDDHIWIDEFPKDFEVMVSACDPSQGNDIKKGDYCGLLNGGVKGNKLYVTGFVRRMPVEETIEKMIDMKKEHGHKIEGFGLETNSWQYLIQPIANNRCKELGMENLEFFPIHNAVKKTARIQRLGQYLKSHSIVFVDNPDMRKLVGQLAEFPLCKYDDGADALEMLVRLILHLCGTTDSINQNPHDDIHPIGS